MNAPRIIAAYIGLVETLSPGGDWAIMRPDTGEPAVSMWADGADDHFEALRSFQEAGHLPARTAMPIAEARVISRPDGWPPAPPLADPDIVEILMDSPSPGAWNAYTSNLGGDPATTRKVRNRA